MLLPAELSAGTRRAEFLTRSAGTKRGHYMLTTDRRREILTAEAAPTWMQTWTIFTGIRMKAGDRVKIQRLDNRLRQERPLQRQRPRCVAALNGADASFATGGEPNLGPLHTLLVDRLAEQMKSAGIDPNAAPQPQQGSSPRTP